MITILARSKPARLFAIIGLGATALLGFKGVCAEDSSSREWQPLAAGKAVEAASANGGKGKWACVASADLPAAGQRVGVCRSRASADKGELKLILFTESDANRRMVERVVGGFSDARSVALQVLAPPADKKSTSTNSSPAGLLLVDQWDESSCYGTQVYWVSPVTGLKSLGFVNEVKAEADDHPCVGGLVKVSGNSEELTLTVVGAIARMMKDGSVKALGRPSVEYRISLVKPSMKRQGK